MRERMNKVLLMIFSSAFVVMLLLFLMYYKYYKIGFEESVRETTNDLANLAKIIIPLVTLVFAIRIYKGLGTSKKISDEQVNIVIDLLRELKRTYIEFDIYDKHGELARNFFMINRNIGFSEEMYKVVDFTKVKIFFNRENHRSQTLPFERLKEHPLLPKIIYDKMDFFTRRRFSEMEGEKNFRFNKAMESEMAACIMIDRNIEGEEHKHADLDYLSMEWLPYVQNECSLAEYIEKHKDLIKTIENWIEDKSYVKFS
jgi:hypothetical protein